jgi:hypothetical protein
MHIPTNSWVVSGPGCCRLSIPKHVLLRTGERSRLTRKPEKRIRTFIISINIPVQRLIKDIHQNNRRKLQPPNPHNRIPTARNLRIKNPGLLHVAMVIRTQQLHKRLSSLKHHRKTTHSLRQRNPNRFRHSLDTLQRLIVNHKTPPVLRTAHPSVEDVILLLWIFAQDTSVMFAKMRTNIPERCPRKIRSGLQTQCIDKLLIIRRRMAVPQRVCRVSAQSFQYSGETRSIYISQPSANCNTSPSLRGNV